MIVPMVNTPEEANEAVRACRYAPEGVPSGPGAHRPDGLRVRAGEPQSTRALHRHD